MKHVILLFSISLVIFGCSTNNNGTVTVVPLAPTNLTGSVISTTQINLNWTDNATNEAGYKIERKTGSGNYAIVGSTASNMTTFNNLGLTPNTSYTYRVYAFNSAGNSIQYSNEVTLTTQDSISLWLTNGLVGYWPFNGNANDESGNGNNGTVNGAMLASDRLETSNKAYFFDGINDVITVTDNVNLRLLPGDFSISLFYKVESYGLPNRNFIIKSDGPGTTNKWVIQKISIINGGPSLTCHTNGGLGSYYLNATSNEDTLWHNMVVIHQGSLLEIYEDGNLLSSSNNFEMQTSSADLRIGGDEISGGGHWHHGCLDDIRIYNRALSASEVAYLASH